MPSTFTLCPPTLRRPGSVNFPEKSLPFSHAQCVETMRGTWHWESSLQRARFAAPSDERNSKSRVKNSCRCQPLQELAVGFWRITNRILRIIASIISNHSTPDLFGMISYIPSFHLNHPYLICRHGEFGHRQYSSCCLAEKRNRGNWGNHPVYANCGNW